ncbi:MAG: hypothetical protein EAZ26_01855, partial [Runella slithyformis]
MFLKLKPSFYLLFLPLALWMLLFLVLPYTRVFIQSFYTIDDFGVLQPALSFDSYKRFFTKELYYFTLFKTFGLSAVVTAIALIVSIPLAYYIAF